AIKERHIAAARDEHRETPFQARHFIDAMRCLFAWAQEAGYVTNNPAANVKYLPLKSGDGFPMWDEDDVAAYVKRLPLGTRQYVWFAVLRYTGLRRGDAVLLGPQHVKRGERVAKIKTEKTGMEVSIKLSELPELEEALARGPTGDMAFIVGEGGKR